jgi:ATP-binding cassette subfamily G (WHITE) protein 2 (SNQ2)
MTTRDYTGLDASTALNWAQAVRTITDVLGLASIMTLYQAGNGIYDLVDDVMVLHKGLTIYYGPRAEARGFFEELGFEHTAGANIADMLTGVTVPTERKIAPGFEHTFPRTAQDIRKAYLEHDIYRTMRSKQDYPQSETAAQNTVAFVDAVKLAQDKNLPKHSVLTVGLLDQVMILARRQFRQIWGDKLFLYIRQGNTIIQALVRRFSNLTCRSTY